VVPVVRNAFHSRSIGVKAVSVSVRKIVVTSSVALVAGALLLAFAPQRREDLLGRVTNRSVNSDRFFGGASEVALEPMTSPGVRFRYGLVPVEKHPWAGVNLGFTDSTHRSIDLSRWDRLEIRVRCSRNRPLRVQLLSDDEPRAGGARDSLHPIYHAVEYTPDGTLEDFPWAAFTVPSWWRAQTSRSDVQRLDLLDRFRAIEFQSGDSPTGLDSAVVEILVLDLVGPSRGLKALGWVLAVLGGIGLAWVFRQGRRKESIAPLPSGTTLVPEQVTLDDPRLRQASLLVRKLGEQFSDPELSLERFAAAEGLSPRLASALIKESTGLHFKGALNELRLKEASRLLMQSKGNISEIGFAVGFQSASHFGRAFREKFGVSPSEFRNSADSPESST
jgi:AraC-like DNA-binding protein